MKTNYTILFLSTLLICKAQLKQGFWRGVLLLDKENQIELPFNFELQTTKGKTQLVIHNGQEQLVVNETSLKKDSFNFKMPVFDTEFRTKIIGDSILTGVWINHARKDKKVIPFTATFGNSMRFLFTPGKPNPFYDNKWEVTFSPNTPDSSKAIGIFYYAYGSVYAMGTFLTETGDYRYLDGMLHNGKLYLSSFDGAHAFLFIAENNGVEITNGDFYSGIHHHEKWIAKINPKFELRNPESITKLKTENAKVTFSFLNLQKKKVSLADARYKNKAVVIQIMGSWCPNCMDETAYLSRLYKLYNKKGLEVIGLAYERTTDFGKSKSNITRLKKRFGVDYEILITGLTGKEKATESLPFLDNIIAFPTTIVLDKKHNVKSIYTGFSGPATDKEYDDFKLKFEALINQLLSAKN